MVRSGLGVRYQNGGGASLAVLLVAALAPASALAHWCDCLWDSRYNVVIRPVVDSVEVPEAGQTSFVIWLQNNMGYPLYDYSIEAYAAGFTISRPIVDDATRAPYTDFVMPGERLRHEVRVSRDGGGPTLDVADIGFYIYFGNDSIQPRRYGDDPNTLPSSDTILKRFGDGSMVPASPNLHGDEINNNQARLIRSSARADFSPNAADRTQALQDLMNEYCAGRHSWGSSDPGRPAEQYCATPPDGSGDTECPGRVHNSADNSETTKWWWQHLWAAGELAYRRDVLAGVSVGGHTLLDVFRDRLRCGQDDNLIAFKAYALFAMGYIGNGAFTYTDANYPGSDARAFLEGQVGTDAAGCAARAGLLLLLPNGDGAFDATVAAVESCLSQGDPFAEIVAAGALNIRERDSDDTYMHDEVLSRVGWDREPEYGGDQGDPSDDELFAAHVANLAAWRKRGWAADAADAGVVSFYNEESVAPEAPAPTCATVLGSDPPAFEVTWPAVTRDSSGNDEPFRVGYRVYWGTTPGAPVHVGYAHGTSFRPHGVTINTEYYVSVTTVDDSMNTSAPSTEITCTVVVDAEPPVAALDCTPTTGTAPQTVTCNCDASTDPDGDIRHCWFSLDGGAAEDGFGTGVTYDFATGGSHTVTLYVTDETGLRDPPAPDTLSATLSFDDPDNQAPTAVAGAVPLTGEYDLEVTFDASGSSDPDGTIVAWDWDFDDGNTSTEANPTHTFTASGDYAVTLTVTDDGPSGGLTGVDVVRITVTDPAPNNPPPDDCGSVTPLNGNVPLASSFDATDCVDPDGDALDVSWTVGSYRYDDVNLTGVDTGYTFEQTGEFRVRLRLLDNGQPPITTTRDFAVNVTEGGTGRIEPVTGTGCGCRGGSHTLWLALLAPLVWRRRP